MSTKERQLAIVNIITNQNGQVIDRELEVEILYHMHDVDGSELILMRKKRRESVDEFIHDELIDKYGNSEDNGNPNGDYSEGLD